MGIRIERIFIRRHGPLQEDFDFEPEGLNLIYGKNETGKTCIIESILEILFRTGRYTPWIVRGTKTVDPTVRKWNISGEIAVSGLKEETVFFTPEGKKLEDFAEKDAGLPSELSRLMVVRAGDTRLSRNRDGVGDQVLRTYLSGKGVLDEIEAGIHQQTVKDARIEDGVIHADRKGMVSDRLKARKELEYLENLLDMVEENGSLASLNSFRKQRDMAKQKLSEMDHAKRHRAFRIHGEKKRMELELEKMASEQDLIQLKTDAGVYENHKKNLDHLEKQTAELREQQENHLWITKAAEDYLAGPGANDRSSSKKQVCLIMAMVLIAVAAAGMFFSRAVAVSASIVSLVCLGITFWLRAGEVSPRDKARLQEIEEEFRRRFGRPLSDVATFKATAQKMERADYRFSNKLEEKRKIQVEMESLEEKVRTKLSTLTGTAVTPEDWSNAIDRISRKRMELQEAITKKNDTLSSLNIPSKEFLPEDPGVEWDQETHLELEEEFQRISSELENERKNIEELKTEISMATGTNSSDTGKLLAELEDKRNCFADKYKSLTAEILAENTVYRAVSEFRDLENARLAQAMDSSEVVTPLTDITDEYTGFRIDSENSIHLRTSGGREFPLSGLSTGAAEQVYIALRTGFAALSMQKPAFLLLDDAFQHSDWDRRKKLVKHVQNLVRSGWQVFYFTMDDHLQTLFNKAGRDLVQEGYRYAGLN